MVTENIFDDSSLKIRMQILYDIVGVGFIEEVSTLLG